MDNNVKKIIAEAFSELYKEIISEKENFIGIPTERITNDRVDSLINQAKKRGSGVYYNFHSGDNESQRNFNKIIDALINDYLQTGNQNSKSAIQSAFIPHSKKMETIVGRGFYNNPKLEDGLSSAYEQVLINNFDKVIDAYKKGTDTFSGLVTSDMKRKLLNFMTGYEGNGIGTGEDTFSGNKGLKSLETPIGDAGGTLGDKLGNIGDYDVDLDTGMSSNDRREDKVTTQREILDVAIKLLYDSMTEADDFGGGEGFKGKGKEKQYIALKSLIMGEPTEEVMEDYPGMFHDIKDVSRQFGYAVASPEAKEVSGIISDIYGVDFSFANLSRVGSQVGSQSHEWDADAAPISSGSNSGIGVAPAKKIKKSRTPKMDSEWKSLQSLMSQIGLKDKDFQSVKLIKNIVDSLKSNGNVELADNIIQTLERYKDAEKEARMSGEYGNKQVSIKESEIDSIMEAVIKRLSK